MEKVFEFDDLMRATTDVTVTVGPKKVTYYQRALTIAERGERRRWAVRRARDMRKQLMNPESNEYLEEILPVEEADREMIVQSLLDARSSDLVAEAYLAIPQKNHPEPVEEDGFNGLMDLEDEKDEVAKALLAERRQYVDDKLKATEEDLEQQDTDELRSRYKKARVEQLCYEEFTRWSVNATIYFSTFTDKARQKRFLKNVESANELGEPFFAKLRDSYESLDQWGEEALKN